MVITSVPDEKPTMFSGEGGGGVVQDTAYLMNHMDKIY